MTARIWRIVGACVAIIVLVLLIAHLWQKNRQQAAQARLNAGQTEALSESAKEAIAVQGAAQAREQASETLTQSNEKEIRDAEGSDAPVSAAARDAGLTSLCRRASYSDSERCRLLRARPR